MSIAGSALRIDVVGRRLQPSRKRLFCAVWVLYVLTLGFFGWKAFWGLHAQVPLAATPKRLDLFYPVIRQSGLLEAALGEGDGHFDVLLLGASVLTTGFGDIESRIRDGLTAQLGRPVRVFNLSVAAHTTRDSYLKYFALGDRRFDLVLIYHGINDVRMNHCPPEVFRADYTHCWWYRSISRSAVTISDLADHARMDPTQRVRRELYLPARICDQLRFLLDARDDGIYLSLQDTGDGPADWRRYGKSIKTVASVRDNIEAIVVDCRRRRQPVLLMSFAICPALADLPATRLWGEPADVVAAVAVHNRVIAELAAAHAPEAWYIDQAGRMGDDVADFVDICHFSPAGCATFVGPILERTSAGCRLDPLAHPNEN